MALHTHSGVCRDSNSAPVVDFVQARRLYLYFTQAQVCVLFKWRTHKTKPSLHAVWSRKGDAYLPVCISSLALMQFFSTAADGLPCVRTEHFSFQSGVNENSSAERRARIAFIEWTWRGRRWRARWCILYTSTSSEVSTAQRQWQWATRDLQKDLVVTVTNGLLSLLRRWERILHFEQRASFINGSLSPAEGTKVDVLKSTAKFNAYNPLTLDGHFWCLIAK